MKTNKTISIDVEILKQMIKHCEEKNISFSKLVSELWIVFKRTYKR